MKSIKVYSVLKVTDSDGDLASEVFNRAFARRDEAVVAIGEDAMEEWSFNGPAKVEFPGLSYEDNMYVLDFDTGSVMTYTIIEQDLDLP